MSDFSPREIKIGDRTYMITRFRGLKAALAGALLSRVMREQPRLQESALEFARNWRANNTVVITPAMARLPRFAALELTPADFEAAGGTIEFPEEPPPQAIGMHMFPEIFDFAKVELERFLALIIIPNSELETADDADDVDTALSKYGKQLMRQGDLDELLELVVVGIEVFQEQMASKRDRLGKLPIPWLQRLLTPPQLEEPELPMPEMEDLVEPSDGPGETLQTPDDPKPSPSPSSAQPSSGDSQPPLDGIEEPSFTEPLGTN